MAMRKHNNHLEFAASPAFFRWVINYEYSSLFDFFFAEEDQRVTELHWSYQELEWHPIYRSYIYTSYASKGHCWPWGLLTTTSAKVEIRPRRRELANKRGSSRADALQCVGKFAAIWSSKILLLTIGLMFRFYVPLRGVYWAQSKNPVPELWLNLRGRMLLSLQTRWNMVQ